ncbi:nitrate- and nitrite sensing domain-containing protein [Streptomyces oceani]|uniref:histidine kinase n=1 Tax=Streptomyces oceani TaxID=1075402 RepID=A0A1E7KMC8_9ACTN|nr:nitrate- and nitrite sensing domain-containing protein [Streptomyces oceani]OEV05046.1 histidine kinase [Streptomyces oceani]
MRIYRRLVLLVAVPLAVAVTFSLLALAPSGQQALQAHRLTKMVEAATAASELAYRLQDERTAATALVSGQGDEANFRKTTAATSASIDTFRAKRGDLSHVPENAQKALERVNRSVENLPTLHAQARSGSSSLSALTFSYRIIIGDLVTYREGIAQAEGVEADVADQIRANAALSEATEHIGQQQVTVLRALAGGGFTPASQQTFQATILGYTESTNTMFDIGPEEWRTWLEKSVSGPKALAAQRLEDQVSRSQPGAELSIAADTWRKATSDRLSLLRSVESRIDDSVLSTVEDKRSELIWWAVGEAVLVLLTLVGTVLVASRLGRVMIRRLRDLRDAANDMAHQRLPQVTRELSQPGALSGATPEQVAQRSSKPVTTTGEDEIGEVGEAFNSVHHEAVRLAAEQADAHEQFAETLVTVARRGAQLTSVMVSELDTMQRDEATPERMKLLFALDHLAIRMERNTNNLLVLGGSGHGRARTADVPCSTVVMAAAQQIEQFERVETGVIEPGIGITARAVHDLAHILAELLDNATRYSPPERKVGIAAWRLWDRAVVQVVDDGVGIKPERRAELNATLAEPQASIGAVRSMGLHVVSRLAARHGIVVELRGSESPGTIAEVMLPSGVLTSASGDEAPDALPGAGSVRPESGTTGPAGTSVTARGAVPAPPAPSAAPGPVPEPDQPARRPAETAGAPAPEPARGHHDYSAGTGEGGGEKAHAHDETTRLGRVRPAGPEWPGPRPTAARAAPGGDTNREAVRDAQPTRERATDGESDGPSTGQHDARPAPSAPETAGFSSAGLPVRPRKQGTKQQRPAPVQQDKGDGTAAPASGAGSKPQSPPRRRDSRQISDVLTAYSQGINRSANRRERPAPTNPGGSENGNADDTQRNT